MSEQELALLCKTTFERGTDHANMVEALKKIGKRPFQKSGATREDIRFFLQQDTPVIVGWWSVDDSHFSVVYDMDEEKIFMMDPELDEGKRTMLIKDFEKVWYDLDGPDQHRVDRWMLVLQKEKV